MSEMFSVQVPATLSNMGAGFDVFGMALRLYNRFAFTFTGEVGWWVDGVKVAPESNLVLATMIRAAAYFEGEAPTGVRLVAHNTLPFSRGLGSSATARVAGLLAWLHDAGLKLDASEALAFLAGEEGHADNVAAALFGGFTLVGGDEDVRFARRIDPPRGLRVVLAIPDVEVSTDTARAALPGYYSREDCVFNISRASLFVAGLSTGDAAMLRAGQEDRIHQAFRAPLIGPVAQAIEAANQAGADAAFISGSGSTLAALVLDPKVDTDAVANGLAAPFERAGIGVTRMWSTPEFERCTGSLVTQI